MSLVRLVLSGVGLHSDRKSIDPLLGPWIIIDETRGEARRGMVDRRVGILRKIPRESPLHRAYSEGMCIRQHDLTCMQRDGKAAVSDWQVKRWEMV